MLEERTDTERGGEDPGRIVVPIPNTRGVLGIGYNCAYMILEVFYWIEKATKAVWWYLRIHLELINSAATMV